MILDGQLQLSSSQALTTTAVATNVIDLGLDRSMGTGEPLAVVVTVEVAADQTTGDEDYQFDIETSSDAAQTTAVQLLNRRVFESGTPTAPAQDADLLVAGFKFVMNVPPAKLSETERYLGLRYTLAGTTPTITVSAHLQPQSMIDVTDDYANGYAIL
jgi:hypothetical protein